jgi:hypothetical protein
MVRVHRSAGTLRMRSRFIGQGWSHKLGMRRCSTAHRLATRACSSSERNGPCIPNPASTRCPTAFYVAMTILVLDLKLPEGSPLVDASAMAHAPHDLWPKFLPLCAQFLRPGPGFALHEQVQVGRPPPTALCLAVAALSAARDVSSLPNHRGRSVCPPSAGDLAVQYGGIG